MDRSRNQWLEENLDRHVPGKWSFDPALPLAVIEGKALAFPRFGAPRVPDPTVVAQFQAAMEAGDVFPAVICIRKKGKKGGIHVFDGLRTYLAALNVGRRSIAAYIIEESALELFR